MHPTFQNQKQGAEPGGTFFLSDRSENPPNNGAVINVAQIIRNVMTLASDAEIGALYINSRQAIPARYAVEEMGHRQPPNTNANRQYNSPGIRN